MKSVKEGRLPDFSLRLCPDWTAGVVQAWVGHKVTFLNPTLRLFSHISHTRLHTTSDNDQTRRHKKHKQKTNTTTMVVEPLALQRCGFVEPTPPEGWAALRMLIPMPPSKRFNKFNKLM
jgi:hypothetical protein